MEPFLCASVGWDWTCKNIDLSRRGFTAGENEEEGEESKGVTLLRLVHVARAQLLGGSYNSVSSHSRHISWLRHLLFHLMDAGYKRSSLAVKRAILVETTLATSAVMM